MFAKRNKIAYFCKKDINCRKYLQRLRNYSDMNLEELKTKVTELGGTQFSALSERTVDYVLNRELSRSSDDAHYTADLLNGIVKDLKELDGNLHAEVGRRNTEYKTNFEKEWAKKHPEPKPSGDPDGSKKDPLAEILKKLEAQEAEMKSFREAQKQAEVKASKDKVLASVKKSLSEKFSNAGVQVNSYVLKQTLRDINIPEEDADVSALSKEMETQYYKNLKEAGFDTGKPQFGGLPRQKGNRAADEFFAKKGKKEGWAKQ